MDTKPPGIQAVETVPGGKVLTVTWRNIVWPDGGKRKAVDLDGWIATGGEILAPLNRREVFERAAVGEHGASVTWDAGEGDLSIDAFHLEQITREQLPFGAEEIAAWQAALGISNSEAAGLLGIRTSTWATYKAGTATMPHAMRLLCRSTLRDPLTLHAWLHPARPAGRPRRDAA
ncbi:hypothetical protein [Enterovirga rhinocerotis]|uniref:DUF2442 domain-containing protein n=1 Tax=Enterovirga rhinocerotis TaxID=1339210 RepID=A0A4R7CBX6_9HYPH|nr:hypothetical protein [Enterovirga rhinocerotis]TDR94277.1 hypothetical protein EV668_1560 [Enterovirga rhinocerotis]